MSEIGVKACPFCQGVMELEAKEDCKKELAKLSGRVKESYERAIRSEDGTRILVAIEAWLCTMCGFSPQFYRYEKKKEV